MDVKGKTVIVTGASRGIGKQIAIEFGRRGAQVVVVARSLEPHRRLAGTIGATVEEVRAAGGRSLGVKADLRELANIDAVVEDAVSHFGGVDILINNAADTTHPTPSIASLDRDVWRQQFDINLHAPFTLIQAVLPVMRKRGGGVIINMTSGDAEITPVPEAGATSPEGPIRIGERVAYGPSKAALNRLTNVVAAELRDLGIAIMALNPGFTRTELVDLMGEHGMVDPEAAAPMEMPVKAIMHLVTSDDPMRYTGQILQAAELVAANRL